MLTLLIELNSINKKLKISKVIIKLKTCTMYKQGIILFFLKIIPTSKQVYKWDKVKKLIEKVYYLLIYITMI